MAELRQTIKVSVDGQELAGTQALTWETKRKEITAQGALGVANHTGVVTLDLNGKAAVVLWLHEDESGYVVVDVFDGHDRHHLGRMYAELAGLVPPRTGSKQRRENRFGPDHPGAQKSG